MDGWGSGFAAVPMTISINTPYQHVGGSPQYTIIGATPGASVKWTTYKGGVATGDVDGDYGGVVDSNGTYQVTGGEWKESDAGQWVAEANVNGVRAMVNFAVQPAATATTTTPGPIGLPNVGGFFEGSFDIGGFQIPKVAVYAVVAFFLLKGKGKF